MGTLAKHSITYDVFLQIYKTEEQWKWTNLRNSSIQKFIFIAYHMLSIAQNPEQEWHHHTRVMNPNERYIYI